MQRMGLDIEDAVAVAGWITGGADICRTWDTGSVDIPVLVRSSDAETESSNPFKLIGVPVSWFEPDALKT